MSERLFNILIKLAVGLVVGYSMVIGGPSGCAVGVRGETVVGMPESPYWHATATTETKVAHFKHDCLAYGVVDGTPEMASCLQSAIQASAGQARARMSNIQRNTQLSNMEMQISRMEHQQTFNEMTRQSQMQISRMEHQQTWNGAPGLGR
jgi:hypothetical protein